MRRNFLWGILVGALLASGAFLIQRHYADSEQFELLPGRPEKGYGERAYQWLLPKDFSISLIYTSKDAMDVLEAPDRFSIHPEGAGNISAFDRSFVTDGIIPSSEDAKVILQTLQAVNAYTLPTACAFQPDVLFRLKRNEKQLDLFLCLSCEEIFWRSEPDGKESISAIGLSNIGANSLRSVLERTFPEQSRAKKLRAKLKIP